MNGMFDYKLPKTGDDEAIDNIYFPKRKCQEQNENVVVELLPGPFATIRSRRQSRILGG